MTQAATPFHGIWPVLVTPYTPDLKIDLSTYRKMIEWHISHGCHGLYTLCLSSEMHLLTKPEQISLVAEAAKICQGQIPIAATGNLGENLVEEIDFAQLAYESGADVVMLTIPEHLNSEEEILHYFLAFAERTDFPLGIYECPFPRQYHLSLETIKVLANTGRFYAFKETSCEIEKIGAVATAIQHTNLDLLQANIPFFLEAQDAGSKGSMNVVANWLPDLTVAIYEDWQNQLFDEAQHKHQILCAMEMAQRSVHPTGVKYLMSKRGLNILPNTRYDRKITNEEKKALDCATQHWLRSDGGIHLTMPDKIKYQSTIAKHG